MANANSSAAALRPSKDAILRTLERLAAEGSSAQAEGRSAPSTPPPAPSGRPPRRLASGVYRFVDEYAGLERLDRAELDETDAD